MPVIRFEGPLLRGRRVVPGGLEVRDGRVWTPSGGGRRRRVRLPEGWILAPGLVDLQVNGLAGAEIGDDPDAAARVAAALPAVGVTAFCPTLVTRGERAYASAARALRAVAWPRLGARSMGVHLEGPFLSPRRPGAHRPSALRAPGPEAVERLARAFSPRLLTIAPELDGALEAIALLRRAGVLVSMGHTEAGTARTAAAVAAGARMLTHAFNAMPAIAGRDPGPLGACLADRRVHIGVIADGVHVAPEALVLLSRAAGRRLAAVSDAVAAAAAGPGMFRLSGRRVHSDGTAVRDAAGRLAGSASTLAAAPGVLVRAGLPVGAALDAVAGAPRRALGMSDPLAAGAPADLVVLDRDLVPRMTLIGGEVAWADPAAALLQPAS